MPAITVQQRSDPAVADAVIRTVFDRFPEIARQTYIDFLVRDIRYLMPRHKDRWGITLFGWGMRLNVGWVECLVLRSGGLRVLVDSDSAPAHTRFDSRTYERAPACRITTIPLSKLPRVLPSFEASHHVALSRAANWQSPPNIRGAHSVGVTELLSVPNPSYVHSADHPVLEAGDERAATAACFEGGQVEVLMNRFERDKGARAACIAHHGLRCSVCGMSFGERYGDAMRDLIHVHHLKPLSEIGESYMVDPINDLRPICPNCHAVIHHRQSALTIEEARDLLIVVKG